VSKPSRDFDERCAESVCWLLIGGLWTLNLFVLLPQLISLNWALRRPTLGPMTPAVAAQTHPGQPARQSGHAADSPPNLQNEPTPRDGGDSAWSDQLMHPQHWSHPCTHPRLPCHLEPAR
jgi:hypothetical protein